MTRSEAIQIIESLIDGKSLFEALGHSFYVVVNTSKEGFGRYKKSRDPEVLRRKPGERKRIMVEDFKEPRLFTNTELDQLVEESGGENATVKSHSDNIEVLHKLRRFVAI